MGEQQYNQYVSEEDAYQKQWASPTPDQDEWFRRLSRENPERAGGYLEMVARVNEIASYVAKQPRDPSFVKYVQAMRGWQDAVAEKTGQSRVNAPLNYEALYALDMVLGRTMFDNNTFLQLVAMNPSIQRGESGFRWQKKMYKLTALTNATFTRTFRDPSFIKLDYGTDMVDGVGLMLGLGVTWAEIAQAETALWDPVAEMQAYRAKLFARQKSRRGWLGTSCRGAVDENGGSASTWGITGLFNDTSVQTSDTVAANDDDYTAAGDVEYAIKELLTDLRHCYARGPRVLVSTAGVACETMEHKDTYTGRYDLHIIWETFFKNGRISAWIVTDEIEADTLTTSNQQIWLGVVDPEVMFHDIILPTSTRTMYNRLMEGDYRDVMISADRVGYRLVDSDASPANVVGATKHDADLTVTRSGYLKNGLFLTSAGLAQSTGLGMGQGW
jgi:hypothetical protein